MPTVLKKGDTLNCDSNVLISSLRNRIYNFSFQVIFRFIKGLYEKVSVQHKSISSQFLMFNYYFSQTHI